MIRILLALLFCIGCAASADADHEDREDHEAARAAVERGELLPLSRILVLVERDFPGCRVVEVDLERKHGRFVYEFEVLLANGEVVETKYDGRTAKRLTVEHEDDD